MFENKKVIIGSSVILIMVLAFTGITFFNNLKLKKELRSIKEINQTMLTEDIDGDELLDDAEHEGLRDGKENRKKTIKNIMLKNIQEKSDDAITQVVGMETIEGNTVDNLEDATNNFVDILNSSLITFLIGVEAISGYLALVLILVGSIGAALSGRAPFVKKGFIALIILGPVIFLISNYGPALLYLM